MAPWFTELPQQSTLTTEVAENRWAQIREEEKKRREKASKKVFAKYLQKILESGASLAPCLCRVDLSCKSILSDRGEARHSTWPVAKVSWLSRSSQPNTNHPYIDIETHLSSRWTPHRLRRSTRSGW